MYTVSEFFIAYESPQVVSVASFRKAIALYCISSLHPHTEYSWEFIGGSGEFPSTPVIFINRSGLYRCTLIHDAMKLFGKVITVRVDLGKFITYFSSC